MKTDIQVGDTVAVIERLPSHFYAPCWAFPPELGSVWVVESMHGKCAYDGVPVDEIGIRLSGDFVEMPGCWPASAFRKVFPTADEASDRYDVRKPSKVTA